MSHLHSIIITYNSDYTFDVEPTNKKDFIGCDIPESIIRKTDNMEYFYRKIKNDSFSLCKELRCVASKNEKNLNYLRKKYSNHILVIPSTVKEICDGGIMKNKYGQSFYTGVFKYSGIESCYFKNSNIEYFGENSFGYCENLKLFISPKISSTFGKYAFYKCSGFNKIVYCDPYSTRGRKRYLNGIILSCPEGELYERCFSRCYNIETIDIPEDFIFHGEKHFNKTLYEINLLKKEKDNGNNGDTYEYYNDKEVLFDD